MVCNRCQKRPAIIFVQRMENGQMKNEGFCLHCARELHIKPVEDLMKQFGMSDEDMDNMENRMESMMEELGDSNPLSMMMNMTQGGEDAPDEDEVLIPGSNATFSLGFIISEKQDGRLKRIELTSKAEEIRHLITSEIAESENLLLKGITEEERRIFIEIGKKMLKNLDEAE